jgi:hypothetical protein
VRTLRLLLLAALVPSGVAAAPAQGPAADVRAAVVRIASHGGSGTVVHTEPGRTLVLSAAHVFEGERRTVVLDVPAAAGAREPGPRARMRVVAADRRADLALLEVGDGPWPAVCPLAPPGHRPGRNLWSVGYDEMRWPATQAVATITGGTAARTTTREKPGLGRSGGALIDLDAGVLIGVCSARVDLPAGGGWGVYVSHAEVLEFLGGRQALPPRAAPPGAVRVTEDREPAAPAAPPQPRQGDPRREQPEGDWRYDARSGAWYRGMTPLPACPKGRCPVPGR